MTLVTTTLENRSVPETWKALDGVEATGIILTVQPEGDVTVTTLTGSIPGNNNYDFKVERNLSTMKAGFCYFAGDNSCFTTVEFAGADVLLHKP